MASWPQGGAWQGHPGLGGSKEFHCCLQKQAFPVILSQQGPLPKMQLTPHHAWSVVVKDVASIPVTNGPLNLECPTDYHWLS